MPFTPTENTLWDDEQNPPTRHPDDREINDRYVRGEGRIVTETNREKLPGFVQLLQKPNYLELRPFYQRRPRWTVEKQSLLIESFVMNIPVPPVFLYERDYNSYEVMDGQQRITAIHDFYENAFKLKGLITWPELNGRRYRDLPDKVRAGIDRRSISSIVLLKESTGDDDEAVMLRQNVFERLNTGGVRLERQEIRNALFHGPFNDAVTEITRSDVFRHIWNLPRYVKGEIDVNPGLLDNNFFAKMNDCEVVLRFFALRHAQHYTRGMQGFLDLYASKARRFSSDDINSLKSIYYDTMELALEIFGDDIYRPFLPDQRRWADKPQTAFYDAIMVGLERNLSKAKRIRSAPREIKLATQELFTKYPDGTFTGRGNSKADVLERISLVDKMIRQTI